MKTIQTTYLGATNTKPSRIKVTDGDNSKTYSYNYELNSENNHKFCAKQFCQSKGWKGTLQGGHTKKGMVFVFIEAVDQIQL